MPDRPVALAPPRWLALRWLLVTVTGAGLIAMHTLMGVGGGHCAGASTGGMTGAVMMPGTGGTSISAPMTGAPATAAPTSMTDGVTSDATGHHGYGSMSMLAHLCLAVLVLLLLVLAAPALLAWLRREVDGSGQRLTGHPAGSGQPRAPPPTNVRLAELCISRR
ncbi:MAG TPA: hypothetical protein VH008_29735 [Pseudonocardia sp.]|jgi:hypothetical protein|nr:hypothetical protein [Pseudonocardia sp.]